MLFDAKIKTSVSTFICITLLSIPLFALPPEIINEVKPSKVLEISKNNKKDILRLQSKTNLPDYVKLYLDKSDLDIELKGIILEYVYAGYGLEISGPDFASYLFPFLGIEGKPVSCLGKLSANEKSDHPLLTGVKKVEFSCGCSPSSSQFICRRPDVATLLTGQDNTSAAIAFRYGTGRVIAFDRPLKCIPDIKHSSDAGYDTYRFAINIDQWLCGFYVPGVSFRLKLHH